MRWHEQILAALVSANGTAAAVEADPAGLISLYNSIAMTELADATDCDAEDCGQLASELLRKAEELTQWPMLIPDPLTRLSLRALSCNNLGCVLRRRGKLHAALRFARQSLKLDRQLGADAAVSCLNLCATLAALDQHEQAVVYAIKVNLPQSRIFRLLFPHYPPAARPLPARWPPAVRPQSGRLNACVRWCHTTKAVQGLPKRWVDGNRNRPNPHYRPDVAVAAHFNLGTEHQVRPFALRFSLRPLQRLGGLG